MKLILKLKERKKLNKIVAIVVTYNRKKLLLENLNSLLSQSYKNFDVFIVDNASTDGTAQAIQEYLNSKVQYFNTGKNIGGAGGFAFGMNLAIVKGYDYCWLMDDDTITTINTLNSIVNKAIAINWEFSFLASVVKWTDGAACLMNVQEINYKTMQNMIAFDAKLLPVNYSSFVSCFINVNIAKEIGLPIKEMFIYCDDLEYTTRLNKVQQGYLDMDSTVIHKMLSNETTDLIKCTPDKIFRYYYEYRNHLYFVKTQGMKKLIKYIYKIWLMPFRIVSNAKNSKAKRIKVFFKGNIDGILFTPRIIKNYTEDFKVD